METKEFEKMPIDDESLEITFNHIDEVSEGDLTCMHICGLRKQVSQGKTDLPRINPLVPQTYSSNNGNIRIYPNVTPMTEIDAVIKSYRPVFGGESCLVLCESDGNQFVFFDPRSKNKDYPSRISKKSKIKITAISTGDVLPHEYDPNQDKGLPTYIDGWRPFLYEAIFSILKEHERIDNYTRVEVNNPFSKNKTLEMITNYANIDPKTDKLVRTDFYLTGNIV